MTSTGGTGGTGGKREWTFRQKQIGRMYQQGMDITEISEELDTSERYITTILVGMGLTQERTRMSLATLEQRHSEGRGVPCFKCGVRSDIGCRHIPK